MPLPTGTWRFNLNGDESSLIIESVHPTTGRLEGKTSGGFPLHGLWNDASQCITFALGDNPNPANEKFLPLCFRGFLFSTPAQPTPGQDVLWTLTGSVVDAAGSPHLVTATARRTEFGWFAQITQVV